MTQFLYQKEPTRILKYPSWHFPTLFFLLVLLITLPSVPIARIPGLYQPIRLDFILMTAILFLFLAKSVLIGRIKITYIFLSFFFLLSILYFSTSSSLVVASVQLVGYASIILSYIIISEAIDRKHSKLVAKYFLWMVLIQIFIHFLGVYGVNYDIEVGGSSYHLFGKYGTFGMPFKFGLFCLASAFISSAFSKNQSIILILIIIAILTSDSRITMISIFLYLFLAMPRWTPIFIIISILSIAFLSSAGKFLSMLSIMSEGFTSILEEGSMVMRRVNFERYLDWVDFEKFIFGGGALSFLEFGIGYGEPGPLDMAFLRLITEFGIIITFIILIFQFRLLTAMSKNNIHFFAILLALIVYSIFNEGIMALRSGHYFFAAAALAVSLNKNPIRK